MGRDSWWQNTSWDGEIEAAFFTKLARARNKVWYLRNQARFLASSCPEVALRLLDQYFALGADSSEAEAHFYRARAHLALRNLDAALRSFEATLAPEEAFPQHRTWAFHELPVLIRDCAPQCALRQGPPSVDEAQGMGDVPDPELPMARCACAHSP
jgi:hypothetical protein